MDEIFTLLGRFVGNLTFFIIPFIIVEYIKPLNKWPSIKYLVPAFLSTALLMSSVLSQENLGYMQKLISFVAIILGIWYAIASVDDVKKKKKQLDRDTIK